jgi:16S rRNA processing protein RimM
MAKRKGVPIIADPLRAWTQPVGTIVATHGLKGAVKVHPKGERVLPLFEVGRTFCLVAPSGRRQKVTIESVYAKGANFIVKFAEFTHITQAEQSIGMQLTVPEEWLPQLDEGEFLASELVGMTVVTEAGEEIGEVLEVMEAGAHDVLVTGRGMIPMVREFVKAIDRQARRIVIKPQPGLLEEAPKRYRWRWQK